MSAGTTTRQHLRPGRAGGRSRLTPAAARALTKAFRSGATMPEASARAGVSARTLRRWLALGRSDTGPYRALLLACQEAVASYDHRLAGQVGIADLEELLGVVAPEGEAGDD